MVIKNCKCFDGKKFLEGLINIKIESGNIAFVSDQKIEDDYVIDAGGNTVCPGYVDIHTHGMGGYDNSALSEEDLRKMSDLYIKAGTTTFYPSFPTISTKLMTETLKLYMNNSALVPGVHLEGPYINLEKRGAQNPVYIQKPSASRFHKEFKEYLGLIKRVTLSPELDQGFELSEYLVSKGIKVSFGHTTCDSDTADKFFDKYDSIATHMFNAMPSIHHRSPSITTIALNRNNVYCEIIPDLLHLHPEIIKLIFAVKGPEKTISVSDSMLAAGLPKGNYIFSGLNVTVGENGARLDSGTLAGSTIILADGVKNLISIGITPQNALMSATSSPAAAMGIDNVCGHIKEGRDADLLILEGDYSVSSVISKGNKIEM